MSRLTAVTGATGFLGAYVLRSLAAKGWRLRVLTRRWPAPPGDLDTTPIEVVPGDLGQEAAISQLVEGADAIVHLAGLIKAVDAAEFERINVQGTGAVAAAWRQHAPTARFVHMSSLAAREPSLSPYAASKLGAESALTTIAGTDGDWRILRPCAVYGPGDLETLRVFRLADSWFQPLLNGPEARVCLIHARDVAEAVAATLGDPAQQTCRELSDERSSGYSWAEIVGTAARAMGRTARPIAVPQGVVRGIGRLGGLVNVLAGQPLLFDTAKVRELLHNDWSSEVKKQPPEALWQAKTVLDQGFAETVTAYRAAKLL